MYSGSSLEGSEEQPRAEGEPRGLKDVSLLLLVIINLMVFLDGRVRKGSDLVCGEER